MQISAGFGMFKIWMVMCTNKNNPSEGVSRLPTVFLAKKSSKSETSILCQFWQKGPILKFAQKSEKVIFSTPETMLQAKN